MTEPDWKKIQFAYCGTQIPASHICRQFDIGATRLRTRAKKEGWERPGAVRRGPPAKTPARQEDSDTFNSAEEYLEAVVAGTAPADPVRVSAARCLMSYQQKRKRVPLPAEATPRRQAQTNSQAAEQALLDQWGIKAQQVRERLEQERKQL